MTVDFRLVQYDSEGGYEDLRAYHVQHCFGKLKCFKANSPSVTKRNDVWLRLECGSYNKRRWFEPADKFHKLWLDDVFKTFPSIGWRITAEGDIEISANHPADKIMVFISFLRWWVECIPHSYHPLYEKFVSLYTEPLYRLILFCLMEGSVNPGDVMMRTTFISSEYNPIIPGLMTDFFLRKAKEGGVRLEWKQPNMSDTLGYFNGWSTVISDNNFSGVDDIPQALAASTFSIRATSLVKLMLFLSDEKGNGYVSWKNPDRWLESFKIATGSSNTNRAFF